MLTYAIRALPVPALAAVLAAVAGWFWLLHTWPSYVWLAAGIATGLLGAAAGLLYDEPAAAVVDALPRGLRWRTLARSWAAAGLVVAWLAGVWTVDADRAGVQVGLLRLYGVGVVLAVAAICTGLRRRGRSSPGPAVGSACFLVLFFLASSNPVPHLVPVFPLATDPEVAVSRWLWSGVAGLAVVALALFCRERPVRRRGRPHRHLPLILPGASRHHSPAIPRAPLRLPGREGDRQEEWNI